MKFSFELGVVFSEREIGNINDAIVAIVPEELLAFVERADDLETVAIDVDGLADGVFVREKSLDDVGPQHGDVPPVEIVNVRVEAAILQVGVHGLERLGRMGRRNWRPPSPRPCTLQ